MKDLYKYIAENLDDFDSDKRYVYTNNERLLTHLSNIFSQKLRKNAEIDVVDGMEGEVSVTKLKVGDRLEKGIFDKYGYKRVERVWGEKEYSENGDLLVYQRVGEKYAVRVSTFDGTIDQLAFVDLQTRQLFKEVNEAVVSNDSDVLARYISENKFDDFERYYFDRSRGKEKSFDLGLRDFISGKYSNIEKIIKVYITQGFKIFVSSKKENLDIEGLENVSGEYSCGFVIPNLKIGLVTDYEIEGVIELSKRRSKNILSDDLFNTIIKGDYIVHQDHGIGIYNDLVVQEGITYFDIRYAGKDRLLVPLSASDKLSKYISSGGISPRLTGLNSIVWSKIKAKANNDVIAIAKELAQIYAGRAKSKAVQIVRNSEDIFHLNDFISKFEFEDSEDQQVITGEIVEDLSKPNPMDRLIVGDVGFGKTELAARAAFLTVNAGLQATVLAPTTILSMQHFNVFKDRFEDYPYRVELLNRFTAEKERTKILKDLSLGKVDILIGTHSVISSEVKFKNLGLMVVDEEQKFGVSQKEELKKNKLDVHVLSLSATPIPRTLNMAISGIRDLSILSSVPNGRKSIKNYFGKFDWEVAMEGINREIERGGQVYYLHNRISDLKGIKDEILSKNSRLRVEISHGRMNLKDISTVMNSFAKGDIDVLVCSSIIENGLDIPNVNTLIIDDSQRYGLSSLYQIRGRVGRSSRQAYAFFFHTHLQKNSEMRLDALSLANNIGSGFILSTKDLELRGAGNILGKSQSGTINSVGYAMYIQMLEEAVVKLQDRKYV